MVMMIDNMTFDMILIFAAAFECNYIPFGCKLICDQIHFLFKT